MPQPMYPRSSTRASVLSVKPRRSRIWHASARVTRPHRALPRVGNGSVCRPSMRLTRSTAYMRAGSSGPDHLCGLYIAK
eukprot:scaffold47485_cov66-Phaeocystis_antarctica.AAC.1